jgi:hypothetical protein
VTLEFINADAIPTGLARIRRHKCLLAAMVLTVLFPPEGRAQTHSAFPVDIIAGPAPQPVMADGRAHLLYELHLTNFSASPIELLALNVFGDDGAAPLAGYRGVELERLLVAIGQPDSVGKVRAIGGGRSVVIRGIRYMSDNETLSLTRGDTDAKGTTCRDHGAYKHGAGRIQPQGLRGVQQRLWRRCSHC